MIYTHIAAAIAAGAFSAWGAWQVQDWRYSAQISAMQKAQAESLQAAEKTARLREQSLVQARQKAEEDYAKQKRQATLAAGRARNELDGLRNELYALGTPGASAGATPTCRPDAGTVERQLLGQCASTLVEVAADADRLAAQVLGLQGYVSRACLGSK